MRLRTLFVSLVLLLGALLVGCGGNSPLEPESPYVGSWIGTYSDSNSAFSGTMSLTVAQNGNVIGVVTHSDSTSTGVTGTIVDSGNANLTFTQGAATYTSKGVVSISSTSHLLGNFLDYLNSSQSGSSSISLAKQ